MSIKTTVGQLLINAGLPKDLRDHSRTLDKKGVKKLMSQVAEKYPERYSEILQHLMDTSRSFASVQGASVSLQHLKSSKARERILSKLREENQRDIDNDELDDKTREQRIVTRTAKAYDQLTDAVMEEGLKEGSPYAIQAKSGSRGNASQLSSLVGADLLVSDHRNEVMPVPIYSNYSQGLDPVEYWAASYGTRKGIADVKFATADAGFLGKQLALAAQRQQVTDERPRETRLPIGLPVDLHDPDNEGAVLARPTAGYPAGTVLTARVLEDVRRKHKGERILIHSPMTSLSENGGLDQWSAGMREKGRVADIGDAVGITAAQAISEPVSQGMLNSKHSAGVGGAKVNRGGFEYFNNLLQGPESFAEAGPLAPVEGTVTGVQKAPQGGHYIFFGEEKVYVRPGLEVTVKPGQKVDPGDDLTDGVPHPRELVKYRGIGEARRVFLNHFTEALRNSGIGVHRRNAEAIVASVINHARITDPDGYNDHLIDQVVPYNSLISSYQARENAQRLAPSKAVGRYLEEPVLHYTPGTRINSRIAKELEEFEVGDVDTHEDPPPFEPHFERLMTNTSYDPDWQTRLGGFYIGRSFQKAVHEGATSEASSTSFVPAVAQGSTLGQNLKQTGRY